MTRAVHLRIKLILGISAAMVVVHLVNVALGGQLNQFGIMPRSSEGWPFILTAPFIHGSFGHLGNNLVSFGVFSALCLLRSVRFYLFSSLFIIVVGGGLVWLFGRQASHIGASGWIFGLWSLSIAIGWFDRNPLNILISLLVIFFYGGMAFGVLPTDPRVSFEGHLFGAVAGALWAFIFVNLARRGTDTMADIT